MVRLVFRPYTQIRRSICTSEPLRASTRVSSGFALSRHSSPSFGSQHTSSYTNPALRKGAEIGRWCTLRIPPAFTFIPPYGFAAQRLASMVDSLVRVSRRVVDGHSANALSVSVPQGLDSSLRRSTLHTTVSGTRTPDDGL